MSKELTLTPELLAKFQNKFGQDVDPNNFYCIQVRAVSTEPIHQGTIYNGATMNRETLASMADIINFTDENIGVLTMHDSTNLNVGRVFAAEVIDEGNASSLRACMAILKGKDTEDLISKIENNVLDEVSVSFTPKHAKCSKCGFDYMGEDATMGNWFNETCPEGHTVGVDGCHLELSGVSSFSEISIVNRGAANRAKILNKPAEYSEEDMQKLAASEKNSEMFVATFIEKMEKTMTEQITNVELSAEQKKIAELEAKNAELQASLDMAAKIKGLEASLAESETKIAESESANEELRKAAEDAEAKHKEEIDALTQEKVEAETKLSEMTSFLREEIKKVLVASGENDLDIPENLDGMSKLLSDRQQILASLVPAGGVSMAANSNASEKLYGGYTAEQLKAFQVKK